eukprot:TRINITY_DN27029_c0_g1_i1.p3 TRINITY_DN27029_c0_g1~~TRINITY_DN27029_c0_g1_i1.p3  ORF type:complete len:190 (+),score=-13.50 TRINITY_DN27029_c0_g1_i1:694-1263(+)
MLLAAFFQHLCQIIIYCCFYIQFLYLAYICKIFIEAKISIKNLCSKLKSHHILKFTSFRFYPKSVCAFQRQCVFVQTSKTKGLFLGREFSCQLGKKSYEKKAFYGFLQGINFYNSTKMSKFVFVSIFPSILYSSLFIQQRYVQRNPHKSFYLGPAIFFNIIMPQPQQQQYLTTDSHTNEIFQKHLQRKV